MIILKFVPPPEPVFVKKCFFGKRIVENTDCVKRTKICLNGETFFCVEMPKEELIRADVKKFLLRYKGNIIVLPRECACELPAEYIFDPTYYYLRALLSSLSQRINTVNGKWQDICVKISDFKYCEEFSSLAKTARRLTVITDENADCERFKNDCYHTYGATVVFLRNMPSTDFDVYADFSKINSDGNLPLVLKDGSSLLYPQKEYFVPSESALEVMRLGVDEKIACAAFNGYKAIFENS